ncbi:MAG: hypothetical protein QOG31_427 [Thermoplasmata archaeon]|jgi:hypothetical protein|nr:hypothetical protein [Thermoplasmata archaeon]
MRPILLLACLAILLSPLATGGTLKDPEITDPKDDGGTPQLDIRSVWVDASDAQSLAFHVNLTAAPPAPPPPQAVTDTCAVPADACVFTALTYTLSFRVLNPDGVPTPGFGDYNRTYVAYRAGPSTGRVAAPMGYADAQGALTLDGTAAAVSVQGTELVLRLPRTSPFVNLPTGATPGAYSITELRATSAPEFCFPTQSVPTQGSYACAPLSKPVQTGNQVPVGTNSHWDTAPDNGFGRAFTFPSPPAPTPVMTSATTTQAPPTTPPANPPAPTHGPTPTQQPQPRPTGTVTATPLPLTVTSASPTPAPAGTPTSDSKKSPAPGALLALAAVAGLLLVRRRLNA